MARLRQIPIEDVFRHTLRGLLRTINRLLEWERNPDGPLGYMHEYGQRVLLEAQRLYPYKQRPYRFHFGEPTWQRRYADSGIFVDEQLQAWLLADVQAKILDLCERYNVPAPACARPDESREAVLLRLKEWCLKHTAGSTPTHSAEAALDAVDPFLPSADLAERCGVSRDALRKRLERRRKHDHKCFIEVSDREGNEPQYLYKQSVARAIAQDMKAGRRRPCSVQGQRNLP